ncbi:hypothetical protein [Glycomyces arizonensis]|uniref:hypothetical protein n=1 Tax=Glycomyces arizonensis TaxID=256035 RepID=UPI0003F96C8B|nr:hypothetical protein [Glycomyces arizonensis]
MATFKDFESMIETPPPDRGELKSMLAELHELVRDRYISVRYQDFFDEKYPGGNPTVAKEELILPFRTNMTEAEDQELLSWCSTSASDWIDQVGERIDLILDKNEEELLDLSVDLHELGGDYVSAYDNVKMHIVTDRCEEWQDDAGAAIRDNYSDHLSDSTLNQAAMAYALANSAYMDYSIMLKIRNHMDNMIQTAGAALANGTDRSGEFKAVLGWLTVIAIAASAPALAGTTGATTFANIAWGASSFGAIAGLFQLDPAENEPHMSSNDPDSLKTEMFDAFDQVEEVVRQDREKLANGLMEFFQEFDGKLNSGDPSTSSQVVPNPNGVEGIRL